MKVSYNYLYLYLGFSLDTVKMKVSYNYIYLYLGLSLDTVKMKVSYNYLIARAQGKSRRDAMDQCAIKILKVKMCFYAVQQGVSLT